MELKSQKQSVVEAVQSVLGDKFVLGTTVAKAVLSSTELASVRSIVKKEIMDGVTFYSKSITDEKEISRYVNGMVDNHLRKAKELNGGCTYTPQTSSSSGALKTPKAPKTPKAILPTSPMELIEQLNMPEITAIAKTLAGGTVEAFSTSSAEPF